MVGTTDFTTVFLSTLNTTSSRRGTARRQPQDWLMAGLLFAVAIVNICGNSLVVAVILRRVRKTSPGMGTLLVSLAAADLSSGIFSALPSAFSYVFGAWKLGRFVCKMHTMTRSLVSNAAAGTLVIIGIERFRTLGKPNTAGLSQRKCLIAVLIIWIYNIVFAIPYLLMFDIHRTPGHTRCSFRTDLDEYMDMIDVLTLYSRLVNYMLPLVIMIVCYSGVIYRMWSSARKVASASTASTSKNKQIRRVTQLCALIVVVFAMSSSPFQIVIFFAQDNMRNPLYQKIHAATWILYLSATCINPVIYGVMWRTFRQNALEMLCKPCLKKIGKSLDQHSQSQKRKTETRVTNATNLEQINQTTTASMRH